MPEAGASAQSEGNEGGGFRKAAKKITLGRLLAPIGQAKEKKENVVQKEDVKPAEGPRQLSTMQKASKRKGKGSSGSLKRVGDSPHGSSPSRAGDTPHGKSGKVSPSGKTSPSKGGGGSSKSLAGPKAIASPMPAAHEEPPPAAAAKPAGGPSLPGAGPGPSPQPPSEREEDQQAPARRRPPGLELGLKTKFAFSTDSLKADSFSESLDVGSMGSYASHDSSTNSPKNTRARIMALTRRLEQYLNPTWRYRKKSIVDGEIPTPKSGAGTPKHSIAARSRRGSMLAGGLTKRYGMLVARTPTEAGNKKKRLAQANAAGHPGANLSNLPVCVEKRYLPMIGHKRCKMKKGLVLGLFEEERAPSSPPARLRRQHRMNPWGFPGSQAISPESSSESIGKPDEALQEIVLRRGVERLFSPGGKGQDENVTRLGLFRTATQSSVGSRAESRASHRSNSQSPTLSSLHYGRTLSV